MRPRARGFCYWCSNIKRWEVELIREFNMEAPVERWPAGRDQLEEQDLRWSFILPRLWKLQIIHVEKIFLFFLPSRVPLSHYHHPPAPALPLSIFLNISCQDYISKRDVRCPKFISFSRFPIIESQFHQSQAIRETSIWIESFLSVCPLENAPHFLPFSSRKSKIISTICDFFHRLPRLQ